jgi:peptidoglycan hydrolase-like protein with peptidoglycan-binding domain
MQYRLNRTWQVGTWVTVLSLVCVATAAAQNRVTIPSGSVILVRTEQALQSNNSQVGQVFQTRVLADVSADGYTLIPVNSRIRGVVAYVQPATRERSGVMQITFDRLTLPDGSVHAITAKLTSTDSAERRQIDARADSRVVLVGERGGIGASIAGAGSSSSSQGSILAALGQLLSEGRDVNVPSGTQLAVQLERTLTLTGRGNAGVADENTFYTAAERIRAAQQALARRAYYRGAANGVLDNATRRALFEFQLDNNITATGNLDGRTATALGILTTGGGTTTGSSGLGVLSARDASTLRRSAQALAARYRQLLGIGVDGRMAANANVSELDLDLLFAFSALADNASLYEQLVRSAGNEDGPALAGRALINAGRRVDSAITQARVSGQVRNQWLAIRRQMAAVDPAFR